MESYSFMEQFLASPGLCHIVKNISRNLDGKSLANCRLVSQSWKVLVDNERNWLIFQLEHITNKKRTCIYEPKMKSTILEEFPEWEKVVEEFTRNQSTPKLKEFVNHMWTYFNKEEILDNPFHDAIKKSNIDFVNLLENCGIDLNMENEDGWTPMHSACRYGNIEMVKLMIKLFSTFDATIKTFDGFTIFHLAAHNSDPQILMLLFDTFKFEDIKDDYDWTMFHHAVAYGSIETVQFLIASQQKIGLNIEETTNFGETIFHLAAKNQDPQVLKTILDTFFYDHEDSKDEEGFTMIHCAVQEGPKETIEFLLESRKKYGFNLEGRTHDGQTILHLACEFRDIEIVDLVTKELMDVGSDIDFHTRVYGYTPLHFACMNSEGSNVAIKLLERLPHRIHDLGSHGEHVLHLACKDGNLELLEFIFGNPDFAINYNVVDQNGMTPLHVACDNEQLKIVEFLLDNSKEIGLDIEKRDNLQNTPEDLAKFNQGDEIGELLRIHRKTQQMKRKYDVAFA